MNIRNRYCRLICFKVVTLAVLSLMACAYFPSGSRVKPDTLLSVSKAIPPDIKQIILVLDDSFLFFTFRRLYVLEKADSTWRQVMDPIDATVGRNGFAPPGGKREGDGRTPSGFYRLGTAFGYAESSVTKMPYTQVLTDDLWIDDPNAPDYNRWVKQGRTQAASYERMRRDDDLYKYGIVIEYNTDPVVKDHGSAIFLHIWASSGSTTAGGIAISENDILNILNWLDPSANPAVLINPEPI